MPRNTEGGYSLPSGTLVNSGDTILVSQHNPAMTDIATAIGNSLDRNGSGGMRAALNMGGNPVQNIAAGSSPNDAVTLSQLQSGGTPVSGEMFFAGSTPPPGWLFEFGQAVSRTTYAALFAQIGTTFGAGDGSTTFNIPDARGVSLVGKDDMGGTASGRLSNFLATTLGAIFGSQSHTLTVDQTPSHNHGGVTSSAGSHKHDTILEARGAGGSDAPSSPSWNIRTSTNYGNRSVDTSSAGDHTHTISPQGGDKSHNNVQPSSVRNVIIFTGVI